MISRSELKAYVDDLKNLFLQTPKAGLVEIAISAKIDEIIREMWGDRPIPKSFALFAIGGYGRGTIHPESDIDLLFFFKDAIDEESVKVILHPLWNLHFKVGHQIRQAQTSKFDETHQSLTQRFWIHASSWAIVRLLANLNTTSFLVSSRKIAIDF
jgi:UTP:GlnB (protein PII) uridylyltransferase